MQTYLFYYMTTNKSDSIQTCFRSGINAAAIRANLPIEEFYSNETTFFLFHETRIEAYLLVLEEDR
jgi:hypothetical protein